jgi:hypothetical protein
LGAKPRGKNEETKQRGGTMETVLLVIPLVVTIAVAGYLVGSLVYSIRKERARKIWKNFGLSVSFAIMFFSSWAAQGLVEYREFATDQREHGQVVEVSDYVTEFLQSTLENWQSEFLQLFSFVVLAAVLIHRGSAESKDSEEEILRVVKRIDQRLEGRTRKR